MKFDFDYTKIDLPITEIIAEIRGKLVSNNSLIVKAPPGAGKSTVLPLALLGESWLGCGKIYVLEPRRLAAKGIASRMASLLGEEVGQTVGYRIRFDSRVGRDTRIEVLTEGILTRMLQDDNALEGVGMVVFDEFHERSLNADLGMALCREAQQLLRPDLRIMIMSATLDMSRLAELIGAPVVESLGRQYPVETRHCGDTDLQFLPEMMAREILKASRAHEGDILAFLPGQGEIMRCETILKQELPAFSICPLYGQLPQNIQERAIFPDKSGRRKVVLATSIAETSLTIEGVRVVVDSGLGRYQQFDPNSGLSGLHTAAISVDEADQRAGRAGRLSAGVCYRMWTAFQHSMMETHRKPEIEQADLAQLMLDMAQWGVKNPWELKWLTPPPKGAVSQASELLEEIGAVEKGKITPYGKEIRKLPCHPRLAHMLVQAHKLSLLPLATDLAAIVEGKDFLPPGSGTDINLRIEGLRRFRQRNGQGGPIAFVEKVASSYRKIYETKAENGAADPYHTGLLLAFAYPERIACARPGNNAVFQLANGKMAAAGKKDDLAHEPWLAVAHIDAREGMGKIFMASPLNPRDLAPMVKEKKKVIWDSEEGCVIARKDLCIGSITLKSTPIPIEQIDENVLLDTLCEAVRKEGRQLLDFNEKVLQWQARVLSLRHWRGADKWPDVSTDALLQSAGEWLSPYLAGIRKALQLNKLDLAQILRSSLSYEQQQDLEQLCPPSLEVPSGFQVDIEYRTNGEPPILSVRLQEMFGLAESPVVNEGKTPVILHLLSPGFKPVQITSDLKSFWENAYFEVKKELKRRYPKHSWPDDPWTAPAVRGAVRKKTM